MSDPRVQLQCVPGRGLRIPTPPRDAFSICLYSPFRVQVDERRFWRRYGLAWAVALALFALTVAIVAWR
jgi:hypothetical protein